MLRIISGKFRGRRLAVPHNQQRTRPTTDRVRETIFNVLAHNTFCPPLSKSCILDLFCGSGAFGFEALSRGAAQVIFVDDHRASIQCCRDNATLLAVEDTVITLQQDARKVIFPSSLKRKPQIVFMDPPYHRSLVLPTMRRLLAEDFITPDGIMVIETAVDEQLSLPSPCSVIKELTCGPAKIFFVGLKPVW